MTRAQGWQPRVIHLQQENCRVSRALWQPIEVEVEPALVLGEIVFLEFTDGSRCVGRVIDTTRQLPTVEDLVRSGDDPFVQLFGPRWVPAFP